MRNYEKLFDAEPSASVNSDRSESYQFWNLDLMHFQEANEKGAT